MTSQGNLVTWKVVLGITQIAYKKDTAPRISWRKYFSVTWTVAVSNDWAVLLAFIQTNLDFFRKKPYIKKSILFNEKQPWNSRLIQILSSLCNKLHNSLDSTFCWLLYFVRYSCGAVTQCGYKLWYCHNNR